MIKLGLIGCGTIGSYLVKQITEKPELNLEIKAICGRSSTSRGRELAGSKGIFWTTDIEELAAQKPDVVVEAASHEALASSGAFCLERGIDLVPASVGALVDNHLLEKLKNAAQKGGAVFYIPSGGIGGMDALQAACIAGVDKVTMTTRKMPRAWKNIPYVERLNVDLTNLKEPCLLYEGPARDCVKEFPQNINIAAVLSLSGIGFDRTRVRILADPSVTLNTHEIAWEGASGKGRIILENVADPENPKTTYLAALSILTVLKRIKASWRVGS
ncbi:MAG: aspartate dehydrogenase [Synergistaceae bacterium]|jgi:aspartate dehydrogenase|nr:aspartate dehydrogenase [Synergistaceae bacterium]